MSNLAAFSGPRSRSGAVHERPLRLDHVHGRRLRDRSWTPAKASFYEQPNEPGTIVDLAGGRARLAAARAPDSPAPDQATQIRYAVRLAYCQPYVTAFFNFLLWDESRAVG